jgi:hypothetical protein
MAVNVDRPTRQREVYSEMIPRRIRIRSNDHCVRGNQETKTDENCD